jgi:hypothetical protein
MNGPDPKNAEITRVTKRGEHYTIEGRVDGRKTECHIPAPSLEGVPKKAAEAFMRRSLYGTDSMGRDGR